MPTLTHIKPGDTIATANRHHAFGVSVPRVKHHLWTVTKRTATQIVAEKGSQELRVRASDGKVVGENWVYAIEATPELIAKTKAEQALLNRYYDASHACDELFQPSHRLNLTVPQLEALAKAWAKIKAMES